VTQNGFPGCAPGLSQISRHAKYDRRESLFCARVRGKQITRHGPSWSWFEAEWLSTNDNYAEGLKQGRSVRWYRSGIRRQEGEFVHGAREGTWRTFHPNGALAEEARYEHGALDGLRRRFFESGRPSLEASYDHGIATGRWRAFYDGEPPNLALTVSVAHGNELQELSAFLPDGMPWPSNQKLANCPVGSECNAPLALLDLNALPPVSPEPCLVGGAPGHARRVPGNQFKPIIDAAREAWGKPAPGTSSLAPMGCVEGIQLSCAPDLDGAPGSELLAQIAYRTYRTKCESPDPDGPSSPTQAIVTLSPATAGSAWKAHGLLGYRDFNASGLEGPPLIEARGFCRIPSGEIAVRARESTTAGDCSGGVVDQLLLLGKEDWTVVAAQTLNACNQDKEPEETDDF
jgi:MORN repeat variant